MTRRVLKFLGTFVSNRKGSPAIEFAIIAPLLFLIVLGTFEVGRALYERNEIAAAAAAGTRSIVLNGPADDAAIRAAINAKLSHYDTTRLNISIAPATIDGTVFKKIEVTYNFQPLVHLGSHLTGITLKATRYAPSVAL